ncbi:MAG TPA: alpha/beta hydrolase [Kofleriaceae bacterium]|nr:alpha/beta hydrolase [Kofleriaceae bacterium]
MWLHGFPDCPATATDFFRALDRRVIAPYLRGYAPSPTTGPFDVEALATDVIALLDRVGGPVDLVGHDWGAIIAYTICMRAPERVRRAVTLAVPHPRTFMRGLRRPAQLRRSWYMAFFQLPGAARVTAARDFALVDRLWRVWSPGFTLDAARRRELHDCLAASWPSPLRYYRPQRFRGDLITTPVLQLHGADDGCILPPTGDDAHRFAERVLTVVPNTGHFLHLEDPTGIAARITSWLA